MAALVSTAPTAGRRMTRAAALVAGAAALALAAAAPASAATEPKLTVPLAKLDAALHCYPATRPAAHLQPIMLVTGTGASGQELYAIGKPAIDTYGAPVCTVDFPSFTTGDIQIAVQYLVHGIRVQSRRAGRSIAVFGISQGGLLPRWALTYWPSLRRKVTDVISAAGTQHGTNVGSLARCRVRPGCPPADWQQVAGSKLLTALNAYPDESPGPTAWTTVRSLTDETVQPQGGPHPTSALQGATNILIQSVCPGRRVTHIGTALDSVNFAAIADAVTHVGPAKISRLPRTVCSGLYAPGLSEQTTGALLTAASNLTGSRIAGGGVTGVTSEPAVQAYARPRR